jgi:group I intron endonuclease
MNLEYLSFIPEFKYPHEPKLLINGNFNLFNNGFNGAGVYMCLGLFTSETYRQPIYIGSSENLWKRIRTHIWMLENKIHDNQPLQNSYNKHGKGNFVWLLLEGCPKEETENREQWYLDSFRPFADEGGGFNIAKDAKASAKGRSPSADTRRKMSEANKGKRRPSIGDSLRGRKRSKEVREKISRTKRLNPPKYYKQTLEHINSRVEVNIKPFKLKDPNGNIHEGRNITKFARENGLTAGRVNELVNGKRISYKKWTKAD